MASGACSMSGMATRARAAIGVALSAGIAAVGVASCKEPTQITVDVVSGVPKAGFQGLAVWAASSAIAPGAPPPVASQANWLVGERRTVILTPDGDTARKLTVRVALFRTTSAVDGGNGRPVNAESCATSGLPDCLVATRTVSFVPGRRVYLPVTLHVKCADRTSPCAAGETCNAAGECVSDSADTCRDVGYAPEAPNLEGQLRCEPSGDLEPVPDRSARTDGGVNSSPDSTADAALRDAGPD